MISRGAREQARAAASEAYAARVAGWAETEVISRGAREQARAAAERRTCDVENVKLLDDSRN